MQTAIRRRAARAVVALTGVVAFGSLAAWAFTQDEALLWVIGVAAIGMFFGAMASPPSGRPPRPSRLDAWRGGPGTSDGGGGADGGGCGGGGGD